MPKAKAPPKRAPNVISHSAKMKGYRYIEKDPALDIVIARIIDVVINQGRSLEWIERETEKIGRKVSVSTIIGWLYGGTKRPQNYTVESVMLALGVRKEWIDIGTGMAVLQPTNLVIPARKKTPRKIPQDPALSLPAPFSFERQDVIDRVFSLQLEGKTVAVIAQTIQREYGEASVKPSAIKQVLTFKAPSDRAVKQ